jgi:outer membrane protein TolC
VFLARRRAIDIENNLLSSQADYEEAVDRFKLRLGLPAEVPVVIVQEEPPFVPVSLDPDSAVTVALHNRLDLQTAAERLEDDERQVRIAADALRAELNLSVLGGVSDSDGDVAGALPDNDWSSSAALTLGLPVNRQAERNAYRSAQINLDQARRDYEQLLDDVDRDVRNQLRQLRTIEMQIELQREQIVQEQRAVAVSQIRYEAGDVDNRDLLDARASLANAQNQLIELLTNHLTARLRLMKALGILVIDADGAWQT